MEASHADHRERPPVLRDRNFRALFTAGMTSVSGRSIASIAVVWLVFITTRSPLDVAWVGIAQIVASIGSSLPSGVLVDRYDRKRLMVGADLARGIAIAGLGIYVVLIGFNLAFVLLVVFMVSAFSMLFDPAEQALLPLILDHEQLGDANGLVNSSRYLVQAVANGVGGALILLTGVTLAFFYNSLTFFLSALLIYAIVVPRVLQGSPLPRRLGFGSEIREGLRWLVRSPSGLFQLTLSATVMNFFTTIFWVFIVVYSVVGLHGNSLTYGILIASLTAGYGLGSLLVGRTHSERSAGKIWIIFRGLLPGAAALCFGILLTIYAAMPIAVAFGLLTGFSGTTWLTAAQIIVPSNMHGRYFALDGMLSWIGVPIAEIAGAFLIASVGVTLTFELAALGLIGSGLVSMLSRRLWTLSAVARPGSSQKDVSPGP